MSYSIKNVSVRAFWYNRPLIAQDAFKHIKYYLNCLRGASPLFSKQYVLNVNGKKKVLLAPDFSNFDEEVAAALPHDIAYENADLANKSFSMTCKSWMGFSGTFATVPSSSEAGCWIDVSCGSNRLGQPNRVDINVSPELEAPEFLRSLLHNMVLFWKPDWGTVTRSAVDRIVNQPVGDVSVGWLTYLSDPAAAAVLPASIPHYALADGVVVQASERPGGVDDDEHVRGVLLIRDTLGPRGCLRDPSERMATPA